MSWDVGYMGTCATCGLRVHAAYEDHANVTPVWTWCRGCALAGVVAVVGSSDDFWKAAHPCAGCQRPLEEWDETTCPRCLQKNQWDPILAAN